MRLVELAVCSLQKDPGVEELRAGVYRPGYVITCVLSWLIMCVRGFFLLYLCEYGFAFLALFFCLFALLFDPWVTEEIECD